MKTLLVRTKTHKNDMSTVLKSICNDLIMVIIKEDTFCGHSYLSVVVPAFFTSITVSKWQMFVQVVYSIPITTCC